MPDPFPTDLTKSARALVGTLGEDALPAARSMVARHEAAGDRDAMAYWAFVVEEVAKLRPPPIPDAG